MVRQNFGLSVYALELDPNRRMPGVGAPARTRRAVGSPRGGRARRSRYQTRRGAARAASGSRHIGPIVEPRSGVVGW